MECRSDRSVSAGSYAVTMPLTCSRRTYLRGSETAAQTRIKKAPACGGKGQWDRGSRMVNSGALFVGVMEYDICHA